MDKKFTGVVRDIVIGACASGLLAFGIKFIDLPQRVTALETAFHSVDKKLDILIAKIR